MFALLEGPNKAIMSSFDAIPGAAAEDTVADESPTTCGAAVLLKKSNSARSEDAAVFDNTVVSATDAVDTGAPRKLPNSIPSDDLLSSSGEAAEQH